MQLADRQLNMKAVIRAAVFLSALTLGACEPTPPAVAPAAASPQATQIPTDPVLAYVSMGPVGKTAVVNDPAFGGNVIVIINTQYNAASGNICRTYAMTSSSMQSQHLACGLGASWQELPPLVSASN